jgi:hypothetical protein
MKQYLYTHRTSGKKTLSAADNLHIYDTMLEYIGEIDTILKQNKNLVSTNASLTDKCRSLLLDQELINDHRILPKAFSQ